MMHATILQQGTIHCFPAGLRDERGQLVNAEVSAVLYDGQRLILASDKPVPGEARSAMFAMPMTEQGPDDTQLEYFTTPLIKQAVKYEDLSLTADGRHVLATTGFDRIDSESHQLNAYNHLLIWPLGCSMWIAMKISLILRMIFFSLDKKKLRASCCVMVLAPCLAEPELFYYLQMEISQRTTICCFVYISISVLNPDFRR